LQPEGILSTLVEFSVAVAGFTGVIAALAPKRPTNWSQLQRGFFAALLGSTAIAAGISILGLILLSSPVSNRSAWAMTSGAHLVSLLAVLYVRFREMRSARVAANAVSVSILVTVLVLIVAQGANAFVFRVGWLCIAAIGVYSFLSLIYFVVLVQELWNEP